MANKRKLKLSQADNDYLEQISKVEKINGDHFCPKCKDAGYTLQEAENGNEVALRCDCVMKKMWHTIFREAGIPPEMFDKTIEANWNLQQDAYDNDLSASDKKLKKKIGEFIIKYIRAIPLLATGQRMQINRKSKHSIRTNSLLLVGGIKSGKSLLASAIVQETLRKGLTAKIYNWLDVRDIMHRYEQKEDREAITDNFSNFALIVIDGVQTIKDVYKGETTVAKMADYAILELDRLCAKRLASGKPVVITSDCSYPELSSGNNWKTLIDSCYKINLPSPTKPEEGI